MNARGEIHKPVSIEAQLVSRKNWRLRNHGDGVLTIIVHIPTPYKKRHSNNCDGGQEGQFENH